MRVQVKKGGMVKLPQEAMRAYSIREYDFLECGLNAAGILFSPIASSEEAQALKKN